MFETLSDKLGAVFKRLAGKGKLTEKDVDERCTKLTLPEANVKFDAAHDPVSTVKAYVKEPLGFIG